MLNRHPWAFTRGTLWALDLDGQAPTPAEPPAAIAVGEVRPEGAVVLAEAMGERTPRPVQERFDYGRRCFAAWVASEIAAYGWVSCGEERIGELERSLRMREGEAYVWDCATLPTFRRRGLYTMLLRHMAGTLCEEGVRRIWIGADRHNYPSIRGFVAAGFQPVLDITYVRIFAARHIWVRDGTTAPSGLMDDAMQSLLMPGEYRLA